MPSSTAQPRKAGSLQAILLLLSAIMSPMTLALLAPVLPQLKAQFGNEPGAEWLVPMIITMPSLCLVLCSPLTGFLADRFGRRRPMLFVAIVAYAIVGMAPLYLNSLTSILISRVLVGVMEASVLTLSTMLIGDYFKGQERDRWLGFQATVATIAAVFLFAAGGALGTFGWRGPFALYGSSLLVLIGIWLSTRNVQFAEDDHATLLVGAGNAVFPWTHMLTICAITLFGAVMFFTVQLNASLALVQMNVRSPAMIGLLTGLAVIGAPIGAVIFRFTAQQPIQQRLLVAFAIVAAGFWLIGIAGNYQQLTGAIFVAQVGFGILLPSLLTWTVRGLPLPFRGRGIGMWQGVYQIGQFTSPIVVSLLNRRSGGLIPTLQWLGIAAAVAAVVAGVAKFSVLRSSRPSMP